MRAVVQRVDQARVSVDGVVSGEIGRGLLVYVGVATGDGQAQAQWLARKVAELRIFPGEARGMDRSLLDEGGGALIVSQFTLLADTRKGRRPSFFEAAPPRTPSRWWRPSARSCAPSASRSPRAASAR